MSKKEYPAVEVEWIDSINSGGWREVPKSDMSCRSVGMLVEKSKDRIILAQNNSAFCAGHYTEIPRIAVKRIRKLKAVSKLR